ncbi:MAG: tyrosine-type recombinase/integrase [Phycisphaerae bacterium]|nr:tyrosine-type recombinase/integrase [Phycisphaerae bacterium]
MRHCVFTSPLADRIKTFSELRRLCGAQYNGQVSILRSFDQFLTRFGGGLAYVTREVHDAYLRTIVHLHPRYRSNQCSVLRHFCIYLSRYESGCYVPAPVPAGKSHDNWRAYIFSQDQVRNVLSAASQLQHGSARPHTFRVLFGLMYTTGLRLGEALALNIGDFHPDTLRLYVQCGKFRKARWVPLAGSVGDVLEEYLDVRQRIIAKDPGPPPLFLSTQRRRLHPCTVETVFYQLLEQCGIQRTKKHGPRVHDLRHTFAVQRLLEWYRDGQDINARLPALATYMGHVSIASTQIYIQATPELCECASQRFLSYARMNSITGGITP